jgi:hypothetical protein
VIPIRRVVVGDRPSCDGLPRKRPCAWLPDGPVRAQHRGRAGAERNLDGADTAARGRQPPPTEVDIGTHCASLRHPLAWVPAAPAAASSGWAVATSVATSRSSITSVSSSRLDDLDDLDALDGYDTRVTRLRAWSRLTGWRLESSSAHRKALHSGPFASPCLSVGQTRRSVATSLATLAALGSDAMRARRRDHVLANPAFWVLARLQRRLSDPR